MIANYTQVRAAIASCTPYTHGSNHGVLNRGNGIHNGMEEQIYTVYSYSTPILVMRKGFASDWYVVSFDASFYSMTTSKLQYIIIGAWRNEIVASLELNRVNTLDKYQVKRLRQIGVLL